MKFLSWLYSSIIKNHKTTFTSIITAFFLFIVFDPQDFTKFPILIPLAKYVAAGGLVSFGISARDSKPGDSK